jgi:3',5'-cyclic AMP phosphodiesterase CpdA
MKRIAKSFPALGILLVFFGSIQTWAAGDVTFAVFSDPHLYDSELGVTGQAFEEYLSHDRKMLRESEAILDATVSSILANDQIAFVVVPGDFTKDGELVCHQKFTGYLQILESNGLPVYVVPGNHDINNPHAFAYEGDMTIPVDNISPAMFPQIYEHYGYNEAIYRDPNSLSYVVEPCTDVWLFALDSCIYNENSDLGYPVTDGRFSQPTLNWLLEKISEAKAENKIVLGTFHHNLLEHFVLQSLMFGEYVIDDWKILSRILARAGMQMVFTGHYHAQDVVRKTWEDAGRTTQIYDVETGSLVTYPSPYRVVTLGEDRNVEIQSTFITEIDYDTGDLSFPEYARQFLYESLYELGVQTLLDYGMDPNDPNIPIYAGQIADAAIAHAAGDEDPSEAPWVSILSYLASDDPVLLLLGLSLTAIWMDLPPQDTVTSFMLDDGDPVYNKIICSTLGNNPAPVFLDHDIFQFDGTAGETVTIQLEKYASALGSGKKATVQVKKTGWGEPLLADESGELPNEVVVTLPESARYLVFISEQRKLQSGYTGDYIIEIQALPDTCLSFQPALWVE